MLKNKTQVAREEVDNLRAALDEIQKDAHARASAIGEYRRALLKAEVRLAALTGKAGSVR